MNEEMLKEYLELKFEKTSNELKSLKEQYSPKSEEKKEGSSEDEFIASMKQINNSETALATPKSEDEFVEFMQGINK